MPPGTLGGCLALPSDAATPFGGAGTEPEASGALASPGIRHREALLILKVGALS